MNPKPIANVLGKLADLEPDDLGSLSLRELTVLCWQASVSAAGGKAGMIRTLEPLAASVKRCRQGGGCGAVARVKRETPYLRIFQCEPGLGAVSHRWVEPTDRFNEAKQKVLDAFQPRPNIGGVGAWSIIEVTGFDPITVEYVLKRLCIEGTVEATGSGFVLSASQLARERAGKSGPELARARGKITKLEDPCKLSQDSAAGLKAARLKQSWRQELRDASR